MGDLTESSTPAQQQLTPPPRQVPFREDCWSEEATSTLVDSWGKRYLELNRGNLRQKDWQEVADAVNSLHGQTKKTRRTDVQCKNRIDTLKKKYKTEKAKIAESDGTLTSSWPFFVKLDFLIGSGHGKAQAKPTPSVATPLMVSSSLPSSSSSLALVHTTTPLSMYSPPMAVPLPYRKSMVPIMSSGMTPAMYSSTPMVMPQKRPAPSPGPEESYFRRNYSAVAAAAAAAEDGNEVSDDDDEEDANEEDNKVKAEEDDEEDEDGVAARDIGMRRLAEAIERFADMYEKVEGMKQRQMIELEKQRMQFAKDLEVQRMQLFMDTQVQLEKVKRVKHSTGSSDSDNKS